MFSEALFRSSLVSDPGPARCIASGVRRLECAQAHSANSRLTLLPSSFVKRQLHSGLIPASFTSLPILP